MAAIQLNFTLRTSANVKTVHLLGSWDNYTGQLPLSKDASKTGGWKSTFRFPAATMQQGQRYWYYYIIDGYHVSHDPARDSVVEPTTNRRLNTLDIPAGKTSSSSSSTSSASTAARQSRRVSVQIPTGRPLPASSIVSPKPFKPGQTTQICAEQFAHATMEQLAQRFAASARVVDARSEADSGSEDEEEEDSDADSDVPSLASSRSAGSRASSPSSVSSASSRCSCERYGITRAGARVKIDCGGSRCGASSDEGSDCCSEEEEDEDEEEEVDEQAEKILQYRRAVLLAQQQQRAVRRQGMVLRG